LLWWFRYLKACCAVVLHLSLSLPCSKLELCSFFSKSEAFGVRIFLVFLPQHRLVAQLFVRSPWALCSRAWSPASPRRRWTGIASQQMTLVVRLCRGPQPEMLTPLSRTANHMGEQPGSSWICPSTPKTPRHMFAQENYAGRVPHWGTHGLGYGDPIHSQSHQSRRAQPVRDGDTREAIFRRRGVPVAAASRTFPSPH
jgi:hypothetical protein